MKKSTLLFAVAGFIGVENPGDFTIHYAGYDGNDEEQKAVFSVQVE